MLQRTIAFDESLDFEQALAGIKEDPAYQAARSRLLVVFEPNCDPSYCVPKVAQMNRALPEAHICGMSTLGSTNAEFTMPRNTMCTLFLFEQSDVYMHAYDCHGTTPIEAGRRFVEQLAEIEDAKGVLFMSSCLTLWPKDFISVVTEAYPDLPIFGAQAGSAKLDDDHSTIMVDGTFYDCGIMAVVFAGADLQVQADYNMGFRSIGREFKISRCSERGVVDLIDELPAVSIYEHHLNVEPDQFFYENVCAFPLLEKSGDVELPRVPLGCAEGGKLRFSMGISEGASVRLSYSKPEYLLRETLASANGMAAFQPQGILMFACMNRRIFMGDELADRELSYYREVNENACWGYGYGEVLFQQGWGGILNSALVSVGFREGEASQESPQPIVDESLDAGRSSRIPLADRLVAFLESTTSELESTIANLSLLAQRDTLTGLFNRRYMENLLKYELTRLHDDDKLVLLMFDIDHFKRVNDTYGHDVGDQVLRSVSRCVEEAIRTNDVLCRWGGEEFLLLFTRAMPELAYTLANRVRKHVEEYEFDVVRCVTISVGVTIGTKEDTVESLFSRVDSALYDAKNSGRNCVRQH